GARLLPRAAEAPPTASTSKYTSSPLPPPRCWTALLSTPSRRTSTTPPRKLGVRSAFESHSFPQRHRRGYSGKLRFCSRGEFSSSSFFSLNELTWFIGNFLTLAHRRTSWNYRRLSVQ